MEHSNGERRVSPAPSFSHRHSLSSSVNIHEELPPAPFSLLKYNIPQLDSKPQLLSRGNARPLRRVSDTSISVARKDVAATKCGKAAKVTNQQTQTSSKRALNEPQRQRLKDGNLLPAPGLTTGEQLHTEALLDALFPPRQFRLKCGNCYTQNVSPAPATRLDVLALHDALTLQLERLRAKECGLCPIREALYSDCFNEIIRQVAVGCGERGKLLYRVKQELDNTKDAWKRLYGSVTKFGLRKALRQEAKIAKEKEEIEQLEAEIAQLEVQEKALQEKYEELHSSAQSVKAEVRNLICVHIPNGILCRKTQLTIDASPH